MMNTRAQSFALARMKENLPTPCAKSSEGATRIIEFFQQSNFPELAKQKQRDRVSGRMARGSAARNGRSRKLEIMQREMERAIAKELYERAAELRDAIKQLKAAGKR